MDDKYSRFREGQRVVRYLHELSILLETKKITDITSYIVTVNKITYKREKDKYYYEIIDHNGKKFYEVETKLFEIGHSVDKLSNHLNQSNADIVIDMLQKHNVVVTKCDDVVTKCHFDVPTDRQTYIQTDKQTDIQTSPSTSKEVKEFWDYFLAKTKKNFVLTKDKKDLINSRLKDFSLAELKTAVDNFVSDDWEGRATHMDLIYCIGKQRGKPDNCEKWINAKPGKSETLRRLEEKYANK